MQADRGTLMSEQRKADIWLEFHVPGCFCALWAMFFKNSWWKIEINSSWLKLGKGNRTVGNQQVSGWSLFTLFLLCGREWKSVKSIHNVWLRSGSWSIDPIMWLPTRTPNKSAYNQMCCALTDCNYYLQHSYKSILYLTQSYLLLFILTLLWPLFLSVRSSPTIRLPHAACRTTWLIVWTNWWW